MLIACSDSRVAPNVFASTDPGDLFVIRNVGNLIPPCDTSGGTCECLGAEAAAVEFALLNLPVANIVVCGHSECGAARTTIDGLDNASPMLRTWLKHHLGSAQDSATRLVFPAGTPRHDRLSQLNVLRQLEHIRTYPLVRRRLQEGRISLHAWWFDIRTGDVLAYEAERSRYVVIDEKEARQIIARMERQESEENKGPDRPVTLS